MTFKRSFNDNAYYDDLIKQEKTRLKHKDRTDDGGAVQDLEGKWLRPHSKAGTRF